MPPANLDAWRRLGRLLAARRIELGARYRNKNLFAEERELNRRMIWRIEAGSQDAYRTDTLRAVEKAYMLVPGSLDRTLAGGELEPLATAPRLAAVPDHPFPQPAPDDAALQEWLDILRRSDPELMRQADPVIERLLSLPHPDGGLRPFREREALVRVLLHQMSTYGKESHSNSGTGG